MPSLELLLPFLLATAVFAFIPGPGMFYMSIQTMVRGRQAGWLSAAGFHLAGYLHILAASFGITILLQAVPVFFEAMKLLGAGYLIWMGVKMIRDARREGRSPELPPQPPASRAFKDSFFVEILNPKTALFFLAFLPQFASPDAAAPLWLQIVILGALANLAFSATDVICVLFSERLAAWASRSRGMARIGQEIGGGLFVAIGLHIALRSE
ncbi:LysE family translocator [Denitrobaculum tricleocarpae]|uniref:LysE family translocator n=1 Tax=Denitrobaculum tricleocarpae TaxID=2591009 RepID=A0A545TXB0_9PROT|nr:LysE family translocator [Denitrobaculum tricleocarpae]TQV81852.1 LysE family translocator [Denitrobaculum tricleocarpae]